MDPLIQLNAKLDELIAFAKPGEMHSRYAPDSPYNTTSQGAKIKKAVLIKTRPAQLKDAAGNAITTDLRDASGQVIRRVPKFEKQSLKNSGVRAYARAKYETDPMGVAELNKNEITKTQKEMASNGRSRAEIEGATQGLKKRHIKDYMKEVRGSLRGSQRLGDEIKAHRNYMARELKETRQIIQAKNKFSGEPPKKGAPLIAPQEITYYKGRLNEAVEGRKQIASRKLERWQKRLQSRAELGIARQRSVEGGAILPPDELKRSASERIKPMFDEISGGPHTAPNTARAASHGSPAGTGAIEGALTHGYKAKQNVLQIAPKPVTGSHLSKIKTRLDLLRNQASGGFEGTKLARESILKSGSIFREAAIPAAQTAKTAISGYPHLKTLGKGLGGAALTIGAVAGIRKYTNSKKKPEPVAMQSRLKPMQLGVVKVSKIGRELANKNLIRRAMPILVERGVIEHASTEGLTYKQRFEQMATTAQKLSAENRELAEQAARKVKRTSYSTAANARNRGYQEGKKEAKESFVSEQKRSMDHHGKEISKIKTQRDAAQDKADTRLKLGIAGTSGGLAGGIIIAKPNKKSQLSAKEHRTIRLSRTDPREPKASTGAHAITGGIEGSIGILGTVPLEGRLLHGRWKNPLIDPATGKFSKSALGKRLAVGGAIGALATAPIGALVEKIRKARQNREPITFASSGVFKDRYTKQIREHETDRKESNYLRSGLAGAALGTLLRGGATAGKAAAIGAGAGLLTQGLTRAATNERDQFGDETYHAKRLQRLPWQIAGLATAGIGASRLIKRARAIKSSILHSSKAPTIQFDDEAEPGSKWANKLIYGRDRRVYPAAEQLYRQIGRTHRLVRSAHASATGKPDLDSRGRERTPEWNKPWVKKLAITGAIGVVGVGGYHQAKKLISKAPLNSGLGALRESALSGKMTEHARSMFPKLTKATDFIGGVRSDMTRLLDKPAEHLARAVGYKPGDVSKATLKRHSELAKTVKREEVTAKETERKLRDIAEGKEKKFSSRLSAIRFAMQNPNWDIRDARGNSARIFAPEHQVRNRRQKEWYERQGTQRAALGIVGIAAPAAALIMHRRGYFKGIKRKTDVNRAIGEALREPVGGLDPKAPFISVVKRPDEIKASSNLRPILFDEERKKKDWIPAAAAAAAGLAAYGLMRRYSPLARSSGEALGAIRKTAKKEGFTRVELYNKPAGRPTSKGPTIMQRISSAIFRPADTHEFIPINAKTNTFVGPTRPKKTKAAVFDPDQTGRLKSETMIGGSNKASRAIEKGKLEEYRTATKGGITMPHTAPITDAAKLKKGYIMKPARGSQSKGVVTRKMIAQHDSNHPLLTSFRKARGAIRRNIKDPNAKAVAINSLPGYSRWQTEQAIKHPTRHVQQRAIDIDKEFRVHTIGGKAMKITSGRFKLSRGNREAERAAEAALERAHPSLKGNMLAMDMAKDRKGAWHVIETNPGPSSGFLTPQNPLDIRGPHQLYKRVTGRYAPSASLAVGATAATAAGSGAASFTNDKRKPRSIQAA